MIIHPNVIATPDCPVVRFHESRELVDLDVELPRILSREGWSVGTYFHIQFVNHEKTILLAAAEFIVTQSLEETGVSEANPYQPMTKTIRLHKAEQIGGWWNAPPSEVMDAEEKMPKDRKEAPRKRKTA